MKTTYSVSCSGWIDRPLYSPDKRRHQAKVDEAIRHHLADMVSEEKIVVADGRRTLSLPIPELKEFRIRFNPEASETVGYRGSVAEEGVNDDGTGEGNAARGKQAGHAPGLDLEEDEVSLEEVHRAVFSQLELPNLDLTKPAQGGGRQVGPVSVANHGMMAHWDRRRTLERQLIRQARGHNEPDQLMPEDLRFWVHQTVSDDRGGAVVIAMMDTSGSMGSFEKYLAKSFFFWSSEFLKEKYPHVDLVFLAHDVRAREVDEETFFHRGASGGTVSSSVYRLGIEIIRQRYPASRYNVYAFHFTDGGNLTSDNGVAVETGSALAQEITLFGYGEIHDTERNPSPLYQEFSKVPGIGVVVLRDKGDIFSAMRTFFGKREEAAHA